jgi:hypothetical protein
MTAAMTPRRPGRPRTTGTKTASEYSAASFAQLKRDGGERLTVNLDAAGARNLASIMAAHGFESKTVAVCFALRLAGKS